MHSFLKTTKEYAMHVISWRIKSNYKKCYNLDNAIHIKGFKYKI